MSQIINPEKKMMKFSIRKGFEQVKQKDLIAIKEQIMNILGIGSRTQWCAYIRGTVEPRISHAQEIQRLFLDYGITDFYSEE